MLSRVLRVSSRIARRPMAARALSSLAAARTAGVRAAAAAPAAATKAARAVAVAKAAPARGMAAGAPIYSTVPMVQQPAPAWKADAVVNGEFKTLSSADYKGKYVVLFFYPLDWTFVCPTEIIAFSERAADFRKIGCEVVGVSVDSKFSHLAWINTARKDGGLGKMDIPLVADICKQMSQDYGVLLPGGIALRGLFIIDPTGTVRISQINDLPIGRSVDETLRLVKALQFHAKHGEVCPADWKEGAPTMKDNPKDSKAYFSKVHKH